MFGQVAIAAKRSDLTFRWYRVRNASVISSLLETAQSSRISIGVEGNRLLLILGVRSLQIFMIYTFCESNKALSERSRIIWSPKNHFSSLFLSIVSAFKSETTVLSTSSRLSFLNRNKISSTYKKQIIPFFCTMHDSWEISSKPNFFISSVSFCLHSRGDWRRPYTALFNLSTLPCSPYQGGILINTVSSKSAYTNALTTSSSSVSRSNLATSASRTRKEVIARVVALLGKSSRFCWLPNITNLALHFWSRPCLSVLYLKTYWHPNTWWPFALALLTDSQDLNCCLCCCMWIFISERNNSSNGWPLSSR